MEPSGKAVDLKLLVVKQAIVKQLSDKLLTYAVVEGFADDLWRYFKDEVAVEMSTEQFRHINELFLAMIRATVEKVNHGEVH